MNSGADYDSVPPITSDMGGTEPTRKLKKLKSIKLSRLPSRKSSTRQPKSRFHHLSVASVGTPSSSGQSLQIQKSAASPNYMKGTNSSDARKEGLQNPTTLSTRTSSPKSEKSLTRTSSLKFRRNLMSKSSGGTEVQRKVKKSRSIKKASLEGTGPSTRSKESGYQASPHDSESRSSRNGQNRERSIGSKPKSALSCNKSVRAITRTSSLKPTKVLIKMATFKSKKPSGRKCSETCQSPDSSVCKATCSSTLKDTKFPVSLGLQSGEGEAETASVAKACPYNYCSLHGHHHNASPPLKRFVYLRRRLSKTQKSIKRESQFLERKSSGNGKKGIQANKMFRSRDPAAGNASRACSDSSVNVKAELEAKANGGVNSGGRDEHPGDFEYQAQISEPTGEDRQKEKFGDTCYEDREANSMLIDDSRHGDPEPGGENLEVQSKLGGEAFDEILVHEFQNHSTDDESVASTISSDQLGSDLTDIPGLRETSLELKAINGVVASVSPCDSFKERVAIQEERNGEGKPESESLQQGFSAFEESKPKCNTDVIKKAWSEKTKNMSMWSLVYKHMVSGVGGKDVTKSELDEAGKEQVDDSNSSAATNISSSCQNLSVVDQYMDMKKTADDKIVELQQAEAIKLVEEAIDEILLPEVDDHSTNDELSEEENGDKGKPFISNDKDCDKDSFMKSERTDPGEKWITSDNLSTQEEEKTATSEEKKFNKQVPRGWRNLKKLILLNRFIKALEKVRKFNPRGPRYLPLEPEPEREEVQLRHSDTDQRKNAEEWMLDYALQQVISKLTPARKRKVELLVKAFETVMPTI